MASQFDDMVTGLEAKSGYQSDSSNKDLKNFPGVACPGVAQGEG